MKITTFSLIGTLLCQLIYNYGNSFIISSPFCLCNKVQCAKVLNLSIIKNPRKFKVIRTRKTFLITKNLPFLS